MAYTTDTFGSGASGFSIQFTEIGNAGNPADGTGYGGVSYAYRMGVTEVPQEWITKTGIPQNGIPLGANKPARFMTWYQAAAFVNFLNTSTGHVAAYDLNSMVTGMTLWSSAEAWQLGGENRYRHKDAYYFLPSDNEWYKAAYYDPNKVGGAGYWDFPTGSDTPPTVVLSGTGPGTAVYGQQFMQDGPADVYTAGGLSPYGTMGQGGNADEWLESAYDGENSASSELRVLRGGAWISDAGWMLSSNRPGFDPAESFNDGGFRVASVLESTNSVPDSGLTVVILLIGAVSVFTLQGRQAASV
jgi:formylglycine-generating enzyme required for sulfatase activity